MPGVCVGAVSGQSSEKEEVPCPWGCWEGNFRRKSQKSQERYSQQIEHEQGLRDFMENCQKKIFREKVPGAGRGE